MCIHQGRVLQYKLPPNSVRHSKFISPSHYIPVQTAGSAAPRGRSGSTLCRSLGVVFLYSWMGRWGRSRGRFVWARPVVVTSVLVPVASWFKPGHKGGWGVVAVVVAVTRVVVVVLDRLWHQAVDAERGLGDHFHLFPISHVQHHPVVEGKRRRRRRGSGAAARRAAATGGCRAGRGRRGRRQRH